MHDLHPVTGHGRFVFPSPRSGERPISDNAVLSALRRMGYPKDEMTGHGFRAMARTMLAERLGVDEAIIEAQFAHAVPDALGRAYNRTEFLAQRRKMMQQWADYLDLLKRGNAAGLEATAILTFTHYDDAVAATVAGQGVVLGRRPLVDELLKRRALVAPFEGSVASARSYGVVVERLHGNPQ